MVKQTSKSEQLSIKNRGKRTNATTRSGDKSRRAAASKVPARKTPARASASVASAVDLNTQRGKDVQAYGNAVKLLNARKYEEARQLLTELLEAPAVLGLEGRPSSVSLIGDGALARHYAAAAASLGLAVSEAASNAAARGLWRLAWTTGLVKAAA